MWARFRASRTRPLAADRRCSHFSASQVPVDTEPSVVHSNRVSHSRTNAAVRKREQRLDPLELDQRLDQLAVRRCPRVVEHCLDRSDPAAHRHTMTLPVDTSQYNLFVQFFAHFEAHGKVRR